jgi:hypothetical protein
MVAYKNKFQLLKYFKNKIGYSFGLWLKSTQINANVYEAIDKESL